MLVGPLCYIGSVADLEQTHTHKSSNLAKIMLNIVNFHFYVCLSSLLRGSKLYNHVTSNKQFLVLTRALSCSNTQRCSCTIIRTGTEEAD